jgi:CxxC motif-containing protein (DUF1111 family)
MKIIFGKIILLFFLIAIFNGCNENSIPPEEATENDILSGGETTTLASGSSAFSFPAPNLSPENLEKHLFGDIHFEQSFVQAPALVNPGLGPLFNSNSCVNCHVSDGRGRPPFEGGQLESMLIRVSLPGPGEHNAPNPVPGFGTQLQTKAIFGYEPEGSVSISYIEETGEYPDGTTYSLRKPVYVITGRINPGVLYSPRTAPVVFGTGLLEAIPEQVILANEDEHDKDQDGVSGKANYVWNAASGRFELGRFGWKANTPTLLQQVAAAYVNDIGITSPYFPMESCHQSAICDTASDDPEITQEILEAVEFYVQTLAVPSRRDYNNQEVKKGKALFKQIGCASCHVTEFKTGMHPISELSNQKIHPYTDLLLHDMGEGLSDNRPDFDADGKEWRTPPLWGIGLQEIVNGHSLLLHDGRARNLEEAILWHDGEGKKSKEEFMKLSKADRDALIRFLKSL